MSFAEAGGRVFACPLVQARCDAYCAPDPKVGGDAAARATVELSPPSSPTR